MGQCQGAAIGGTVALHDAVAHVGIVGNDGSTAILVDVHVRVGKVGHLCIGITAGDVESVDDGTVGDRPRLHRQVVCVTLRP